MSGSHTASSRSPSPGSSRSSGRNSRSDTTPSPSGGNRPAFNPHRLTSKLAFVDASESLAYAAKTLAIAAQAMSKAASSLAVASRCQYDDCDSGVEDDSLGRTYEFGDQEEYPEWQAQSYTLPSSGETYDDQLSEPDEGYMLPARPTVESPRVQPAALQMPPAMPQGSAEMDSSGNDNTSMREHEDETISYQITTPEPSAKPEIPITTTPSVTPAQPIGSAKPVAPTQPVAPMHSNPPGANTSSQVHTTAPLSQTTPKPAPVSTGPAPAIKSTSSQAMSGSNLGSGAPSQGPGQTRIVLDRGFDLLPAACEISKRCAKTIYFYPITGGSCIHNAAAVIKHNVSQGVIVPSSLKPDKLLAAAKAFSKASSGALVWPGDVALQGITGLGSANHIQIVYLGEPLKENANLICPRTTIILTKTEQSNLKPATLQSMNKKFKLDAANDQYNMQGAGSALHKSRTWLRSRLTDMSFVRGFYWGYILHCRKQQPKWTAVKLVQNANRYAEECLLRGPSRESGELVGPQITISRQDAQGQKLQPAVQAGILSVY